VGEEGGFDLFGAGVGGGTTHTNTLIYFICGKKNLIYIYTKILI
jgi:hypothetical protein